MLLLAVPPPLPLMRLALVPPPHLAMGPRVQLAVPLSLVVRLLLLAVPLMVGLLVLAVPLPRPLAVALPLLHPTMEPHMQRAVVPWAELVVVPLGLFPQLAVLQPMTQCRQAR